MRLFSVLTIFLMSNLPIYAQNLGSDPIRTVSVIGQADLDVAPDQAQFYVGVRQSEDSAELAASNVTDISNNISKILEDAGIQSKDIKTNQVQISIRYSDNSGSLFGDADSYEAYIRTNVLVRDLSLLPSLLGELSKSGANDLGALSFDISNKDEIEEEVMLLAVDDASDTAAKLSERAGMTLGDPIQITYGDTHFESPILLKSGVQMEAASYSGDNSLDISAGTIRLTSEVSMAFEMTK